MTRLSLVVFLVSALLPAWAVTEDSVESVPHAVKVARTTAIPGCTMYVDAASKGGDGTAGKPYKTIAAAVEAAQPGAVICVAEGSYAEQIAPGEKYFTLAGGFQRGSDFKVARLGAVRLQGAGQGRHHSCASRTPAPRAISSRHRRLRDHGLLAGHLARLLRVAALRHHQQLHPRQRLRRPLACRRRRRAEQRVGHHQGQRVREELVRPRRSRLPQRLHEREQGLHREQPASTAIQGPSPTVRTAARSTCSANTLSITGNEFTNNSVTQWGGGLYVGAYTARQSTDDGDARLEHLSRQPRRRCRRRHSSATTARHASASHEIYDSNCGGNILLDGGAAARARRAPRSTM